MESTLPTLLPTRPESAINVKVGDKIQSAQTGKIYEITSTKKGEKRIDFIFGNIYEFDMLHYSVLQILKKD